MTRFQIRQRVEYAAVRALTGATSALPEHVSEKLAARVASLLYAPVRLRAQVAEDNLRHAFPGADEAWIRTTAQESFRHIGREAVAMLRLGRYGADEVVARTDMVGWEQVEEARAAGRGGILFTGHFGNWEVAAASTAARGVPITAVVRRQRNSLFDAYLDGARRRLGIETVAQKEAPRAIPRALRANHMIGLVADQDARRSGVFVPFFGRPASTHRGPAMFALRFGVPIFACSARRLPGEIARYECRVDRVEIEPSGDSDADIARLTARLAAHLEQTVRQAPEQYFWVHRRWKTRPAEGEPVTKGNGTTLNQ